MIDNYQKTFKVLLADFANSDISAEIPYLFKKAGCLVDIFCNKESWLLKNSQWDKWVPSPTNEDLYAKQLQQLASSLNYDWIVLADDAALRIMNGATANPVLAKKILPLSKLENRGLLGTKALLSELCEKHGIITPPFAIFNNRTLPNILAQKTGFPLVLKINQSGAGSGVFYCKDEDALVKNLGAITEKDKNNLVFQKYIKGDNIAVEALYKNGSLLAYACSAVVETMGHEFNVSMVRNFHPRPEIEPILSHIGATLGINGFGTLTFIFEKDTQKYFLLEADLRPQTWFRLSKLSGVDFSQGIQNYLNNTTALIRPAHPGKIIRHFNRELSLHIKQNNFGGLFKWLTNIGGRWKSVPWYDKKLLWNTVKNQAKFMVAGSMFWPIIKKSMVFLRLRGKTA